MSQPRLLALSGSLRQHSHNTALLRALAAAIEGKADLTLHPLGSVPLYDQDADAGGPPGAVAALRAAIATADGLVIASPEYNHGMSGVLKNALDWASRPFGQSTLTGKPVLTMTASPGGVGGARAHAQLNETLNSIGARVLLRPQAVIPAVHEKLDGNRIIHEPTLGFLLEGLDDLLRDIASAKAFTREAA